MARDPITKFDLDRLKANNYSRKIFKVKGSKIVTTPPPIVKTVRVLYGLVDTPEAKVFDTVIRNGALVSTTQVGSTIQGANGGGAVDQKMGFSVSLSKDGTIAAISSPTAYDSNYESGSETGNVKVYEYNGTSWSQKGSTLYADETQDETLVGWSVDLSDDGLKLLVQSGGVPGEEGHSTARSTYYVFESGDWVKKARPNQFFRSGVRGQISNDGNVLIVTNPGSDFTPLASIWEYDSSGDSWSKREDITIGLTGGVGVDINNNGSRICFGTYRDVKVYEWDGSSYNLMGSQIDGDDNFELSIFCRMNDAGDIVAVGAPQNDDKGSNTGVIRVYRWNGSSWVKDNTELYDPAPSNNDNFGAGLEINPTGDIIVGASGGHISIFQYYNGDWVTAGSLTADTGPQTNSASPGFITQNGQFTIGLSEI